LRYVAETNAIEENRRNAGREKGGSPELWNSILGSSHSLGITLACATGLTQ
jgi:hypothetical protein